MKKITLLLLLILGTLPYIRAQKAIDLYDGLAPNSLEKAPKADSVRIRKGNKNLVTRVGKPQLEVYLPKKFNRHKGAIIICPGGGYSVLAIEHEGRWVAEKMNEKGYAAFVLKYRLPDPDYVKNKKIVPIQDAQRAIQIVREKAADWGIAPNKIGIMGFSAGGHLASTAGTHFHQAYIDNPKKTSLRPDFIMLNYPVVSFKEEFGHLGSRLKLIGPVLNADEWEQYKSGPEGKVDIKRIPVPEEDLKQFSNELRVTADTPPTFIQHAMDDKGVPVQNSLLFLAALQQHGIRTGTFFYEKGGHGYGMDNSTSNVQWFEPFIAWLDETLSTN